MEDYFFAFGFAGLLALVMVAKMMVLIRATTGRPLVEDHLKSRGYRLIGIESAVEFLASRYEYRPRFAVVAEAPDGRILRGMAYVGSDPFCLWPFSKRVVVSWRSEVPMFDDEVDGSGLSGADRPGGTAACRPTTTASQPRSQM